MILENGTVRTLDPSLPVARALAIAADRVATVSKGEEAPACRESHEPCWQQNRRGHALITAK